MKWRSVRTIASSTSANSGAHYIGSLGLLA